jgi:uncharacterized Fe-S cluster-containing radical SAM superfamily enzyme
MISKRCKLIHIKEDIPLLGSIAFGLIDRGTNVIQVRPISTCPLSCIFCSTDAGPNTKKRRAEYIVDLDHLIHAFSWVASLKSIDDLEAHIDTVGEPASYSKLVELVQGLAQNEKVKIVSMQTNGVLLNEKILDELSESGLSRINLSIESLDPDLAKKIAGTPAYNLSRVKENAEYIVKNTEIDLLIAPVWVPDINEGEMPRLIEYALRIGAGKKWPPLGIQKYIPHKYGRKPDVPVMGWRKFYSKLAEWEKAYNTKLILAPEDFNSYTCKPLPRVFSRYERVKVKVVVPGWMEGEMLAVARERAITLVGAKKIPIGAEANARMLRVKDGIYIGRPER